MTSKNYKVRLTALGLVTLLSLTACAKKDEPLPPAPSVPEDTVVTEPVEVPNKQPELPEAPQPMEDPTLTQLRQTLADQNVMGGILFLGYFEDAPLSDAFWDNLEKQGYLAQYPFLEQIPRERVAKTDGGEIYCIIPTDPKASVSVTEWIADETNDFEGDNGALLYRSNVGAPFLVCGNASDLISNVAVSMMDSAGNSFSNYTPSISLKDGSVTLPQDGETPLLLDCSLSQPADSEQPAEYTVELYQGNANADGFDVSSVTVDTLNEDTLLQLMISKGILPDTVEILHFSQDGTHLQLDLNAAFGDYMQGSGTSGEYLTMGSLVNTFLSAFDSETMTLTVNGKPLETGHDIYDYDLGFYE